MISERLQARTARQTAFSSVGNLPSDGTTGESPTRALYSPRAGNIIYDFLREINRRRKKTRGESLSFARKTLAAQYSASRAGGRYQNRKAVRLCQALPARRVMGGKLGWLGASGKAWVSRQRPWRRL